MRQCSLDESLDGERVARHKAEDVEVVEQGEDGFILSIARRHSPAITAVLGDPNDCLLYPSDLADDLPRLSRAVPRLCEIHQNYKHTLN